MIVRLQNDAGIVVSLCAVFVLTPMACVKNVLGTHMNSLMSITENQPLKLTDYEIIEFICRENFNQKKRAWKVGDWLAVSYNTTNLYKIYRLNNGKPLLSVVFDKAEDAVWTAKVINDAFEEYFNIWQEYENADIFALAKWSARNGIEIYEILKSLPPRIKSMEDIQTIEQSKSLKDKVLDWYNERFTR